MGSADKPRPDPAPPRDRRTGIDRRDPQRTGYDGLERRQRGRRRIEHEPDKPLKR